MPLYKMMHEMPYDEFQGWLSYFEKRPTEWRHDLRTFYIMQAFGDKRKATDVFPSLKAISKQSENPLDSLKGSYLFQKILSAKGGEKLEV